jgi:hydrogenase nickel incorporation protein HypB
MCGICGCDQEDHRHNHEHEHEHEHNHEHEHEHEHQHQHHHHNAPTLIQIEQNILAKNASFALENKTYLKNKNIIAFNFMSSPGSGKTSLLSKTVNDLKFRFQFSLIVGDQQTDNDAKKLKTTGASVLQINTGKGCHLDAHSISHGLRKLPLSDSSMLFIENVGNLVCPSLFDLGESYKIVILSVTEGEDKPEKYPNMFHCADLVLITKIDLLPYLEFDLNQCVSHIQKLNKKATILNISAKTGENLNTWYQWLHQKHIL